jgi:hypothetical protein
MAGTARRWRLAGWLVLAAILTTGCNIPSLLYFLYPGGDIKQPPELVTLTPLEKGKPVKIAVISYSSLPLSAEFATIDRDLAGQLSQQLFQDFKENKQAISIVPTSKTQEFKNDHPGWKQSMGLKEIAQYFKVDYLIYLEIDSMSLYEIGSQKTLYYGRTNITVSVLNSNKPDESPYPKSFNCEYPKSKGPISVDDSTPPRAFYMAFVNYVAKRLSWYFIPHEINQDITCE